MSNELKCTPGNWEIGLNRTDELTVYSIVKDEPAKVVESEDDYRLFAASKDLYNALRELLESDYTSGTHLYTAQIRAKEAILKANKDYRCPVRLP